MINHTYDQSVKKLYENYSVLIGESSSIYNGPEYYYEDESTGGDPFFLDTELHDGLVVYEGHIYGDLDVGYDSFRDELFIARYNYDGSSSLVRLLQDKVNAFQVSGHNFIRLPRSKEKNSIDPGYYELLYDGKLKVVAKRFKTISPSDDGIYRYRFSNTRKLFLRVNEIFYAVRSKSAIRKLLKDQKRSIREYSNDNMAYLLDLEDYLLLVASYYDDLKTEVANE